MESITPVQMLDLESFYGFSKSPVSYPVPLRPWQKAQYHHHHHEQSQPLERDLNQHGQQHGQQNNRMRHHSSGLRRHQPRARGGGYHQQSVKSLTDLSASQGVAQGASSLHTSQGASSLSLHASLPSLNTMRNHLSFSALTHTHIKSLTQQAAAAASFSSKPRSRLCLQENGSLDQNQDDDGLLSLTTKQTEGNAEAEASHRPNLNTMLQQMHNAELHQDQGQEEEMLYDTSDDESEIPTTTTTTPRIPPAARWTTISDTFFGQTMVMTFKDASLLEDLRQFVQVRRSSEGRGGEKIV